MDTLKIGKGESITIVAEIVDDIEAPIDVNDSLLFAIKRTADDDEFLFNSEKKFSEMSYDANTKTYTYIVEISSETSILWSYGDYLYDWTLIRGSEHFPQTEPLLLIVDRTIGASGAHGTDVIINIGG